MSEFVPEEKLSKREKRRLNNARRKSWGISPITRRPKNSKAYDRSKTRKELLNL